MPMNFSKSKEKIMGKLDTILVYLYYSGLVSSLIAAIGIGLAM